MEFNQNEINEKEDLISNGYENEINDIVDTIKEVLQGIKIFYKSNKSLPISPFLEIKENNEFGRLTVFFNFREFEKEGWGIPSMYSKLSVLSENERYELLATIERKIMTSFNVALPNFNSSLVSTRKLTSLTTLGRGDAKSGAYGGHLVLRNQDFLNYLNS